jgi:hypothetical protein
MSCGACNSAIFASSFLFSALSFPFSLQIYFCSKNKLYLQLTLTHSMPK